MTERTLSEIAAYLGGVLHGDGAIAIRGLAGVLDAEPGEITFVGSAQYARQLSRTRASAVVLAPEFEAIALPSVRVAKPERAFERLVEWFRPAPARPPAGVHPSAVIAADARIGTDASIGPFVSIGAGAQIGARAILHAGVVIGDGAAIGDDSELRGNVVIGARVRIGARVLVHGNAVIGADGFGFRPGPRGLEKLEHIGTVVVGDDVEIGAGTTIDRARFGRTVIGRGTKIDNLVQIAHNVRIGEHCVIAAQTGVSGSTIVGNGCLVGGQVGTVGHVTIGDGCQIAARAGISKDTAPGSVVYGFIGGPHLERKREEAAVRQLPALLKRVRELERRARSGSAGEDDAPSGGTASTG